jgi:chromosomal replication initiator protein
VALEPPELEMRVAILLAKAAATGLTLDEQGGVLHRQAHPLQRARAGRRPEARDRLLELPRQEITLASPRKRCATCSPSRTASSRSRNIQKTVADYYKIRHSDMHSKKRSRAVGSAAAGGDGRSPRS